MPFASVNPTNLRTNPWNFHKKFFRIGDFEKLSFFESVILDFFGFFLGFIPMKISQSYLGIKVEILMITMVYSKRVRVRNNLLHSVHIQL